MRLPCSSHPCRCQGAREWWSGVGRSADLPLCRIKDHRAGPATEVSRAAQGPAVHADGRRCTWMYETKNETAPIGPQPLVMSRRAVRVTALGSLLGTVPR